MSTTLQPWRILLVEDEALLAEEAADRLRRLGHHVVAIVDTGRAAIEAAGRFHPDLILMDIRIKGAMNGIEAADRIFADFAIPVIFTSAHSDEDTLRRAEIPGQYGYVIKPYREQDLVMALRLAVNRREAEGVSALARSRMVAELVDAASRDEFFLHLQPIVDVRSAEVVKAEALLRWRSPSYGDVPPVEFVPLLEETGLIHEVGEWVFDEALRIADRIEEAYGRVLPISVNLSVMQLQDTKSSIDWDRKLASLPLRGRLGVEVTESTLAVDADCVQQRLQTFRRHGLPVSIDDFGTGFSSLSYLKLFEIDYLKIDASFVQGMASDVRARALTESIVDLAHRLGLRTIAEGVETEEQRDLLAGFGCDLAQGYLYSRPLPEDAFLAYLTRSSRVRAEAGTR